MLGAVAIVRDIYGLHYHSGYPFVFLRFCSIVVLFAFVFFGSWSSSVFCVLCLKHIIGEGPTNSCLLALNETQNKSLDGNFSEFCNL